MRSFLFLFLLPVLLILASCTDSISNVGLDLLGDEANPQVETIHSTSFSTSDLVDITGASPRILVGSVNDPLTGQISTNGFLDFAGTFAGTPSESITSAQLKLSRNYNYGDTTKTVEFSLHQILQEWNHIDLRSDTDLTIGPQILTVTTLDTLTTIDLPASWISENENDLRSAEFNSKFHGFALIQINSGQVIGFNAALSEFELTSASGVTEYSVISTYTQIKRMSPSTPPDGLLLFQDGAGPAIELNFDLNKYKNSPINNITLSFSADQLASQDTPENFLRPFPQILQLVAVPADATMPASLVGQAAMDKDGEYHFSDIEATIFFQRVLFGSQQYDRLELRSPVENNSLNAVLFHGMDARDLSPRATIILSP
ncbi:MAG: hypothetical protein OXE92_04995 [Bacteroidetes bacterium]|nr:hypothetical protein [Bacteroidota bacterium]